MKEFSEKKKTQKPQTQWYPCNRIVISINVQIEERPDFSMKEEKINSYITMRHAHSQLNCKDHVALFST